jgi:hypothetical protein
MLVFVLGGILGTGYKIKVNESHSFRGIYGEHKIKLIVKIYGENFFLVRIT